MKSQHGTVYLIYVHILFSQEDPIEIQDIFSQGETAAQIATHRNKSLRMIEHIQYIKGMTKQ